MESFERQSGAVNHKSSPLLGLLILALIIRGGVLFASLSSFNDDPDDYARLAENWSSYGVFGTKTQATAFRPPLYPLTLKYLSFFQISPNHSTGKNAERTLSSSLALSRNASIALWHWVLGLATVLLVYRAALLADLSPRAAAFAGLLVAVDPILLQQSRLVMTETLAAFFAAALLPTIVVCVQKRNSRLSSVFYLGLGILFGLSTLCRPTFFVFAGLVLFCAPAVALSDFLVHRKVATSPKPRVSKTLFNIAFLLAGMAAVDVPWLVRNLREFRRPILTTTHGGYTLYLANNPELYRHYRTASPWTLWNPRRFHEQREKNYLDALKKNSIEEHTKEAELFQDKWTRQEARKTIFSSPQTFVYSCFIRAGELWRLVPNNVEQLSNPNESNSCSPTTYARRAIGCFYAFEFFFALIGLLRIFGRPARRAFTETPFLWGLLLILSVQTPHLIYWTNMRMRAPLEVFLPILTAIGAGIVKDVFLAKTTRTSQQSQPADILESKC